MIDCALFNSFGYTLRTATDVANLWCGPCKKFKNYCGKIPKCLAFLFKKAVLVLCTVYMYVHKCIDRNLFVQLTKVDTHSHLHTGENILPVGIEVVVAKRSDAIPWLARANTPGSLLGHFTEVFIIDYQLLVPTHELSFFLSL